MVNDKIPISDIVVSSERLRPIDEDQVDLIATSVIERGLLTPIRIRANGQGGYILIAGAHRLQALKNLKWETLTVGDHVIIAAVGDIEAKIEEIDENLARHELNALDRAISLAKRKKLNLALKTEAARGGDRKSQKYLDKIKEKSFPFDSSFSKQTAKRIGITPRAVNLAVQIAENLDEEAIKDLRKTKVVRNQKELKEISKLDPERQRAVAKHLKEGKAKTVHFAKIDLKFSHAAKKDPPGEKLVATIIAGFPTLNVVQQERVLKHLNLTRLPAKENRRARTDHP